MTNTTKPSPKPRDIPESILARMDGLIADVRGLAEDIRRETGQPPRPISITLDEAEALMNDEGKE